LDFGFHVVIAPNNAKYGTVTETNQKEKFTCNTEKSLSNEKAQI